MMMMIISKFCESTCLPPQSSLALSSSHLRRIQPESNHDDDQDGSNRLLIFAELVSYQGAENLMHTYSE